MECFVVGKSKATVFCANCGANFCGECFDYAHVDASMKQHISTQPSNKHLVVCTQHSNKVLDGFCNTCDKPMCSDCLDGPCKQHNTVAIADKITQSKDRVTTLVAQLAECTQKLSQKTVEIQSAIAEDIQRQECILSSVQQAIAQVRLTLNKCEEKILDQIKQVHSAAAKSMQLHFDHISTITQCAQFVSESCSEAITDANSPKAISMVALSSCVAQANSVLAQCTQLCTISVPAARPKFQLSKQMQHQITKLTQQIEHDVKFSDWIVDCGKASQSISWNESRCVGRPDGSADLNWQIVADESSKATTCQAVSGFKYHALSGFNYQAVSDFKYQAVSDFEFQVVIVGKASQPLPQQQLHQQQGQITTESIRRVVYQGSDMGCKIDGLECGRDAVFELGVCVGDSFVFAVGCGVLNVAIPKCPVWFVEADPSYGLTISEDTLRVACSGRYSHHRYCFGNEIPRGGVVKWGVRVTTSVEGSWVFVGIISQNTKGSYSYASQSSFGWASQDAEFTNARKHDDGFQWQSGDTATLTLDMDNNTLTLIHHRTNETYALEITPNTTWRVHVNLLLVGSAVELFDV